MVAARFVYLRRTATGFLTILTLPSNDVAHGSRPSVVCPLDDERDESLNSGLRLRVPRKGVVIQQVGALPDWNLDKLLLPRARGFLVRRHNLPGRGTQRFTAAQVFDQDGGGAADRAGGVGPAGRAARCRRRQETGPNACSANRKDGRPRESSVRRGSRHMSGCATSPSR